jgi:protein ImuB
MTQRRLLSLWLPEWRSQSENNPGLKSSDNAAPDNLATLALWCQAYSPLTAITPPDGVLIDITGCAHLFGGEAGLTAHLQSRLPGARVAIANTATAAWGLARYGVAGNENILSLPLAALGLAEKTIIKLRRVGVRRIGELKRLPRAELLAGYGPEPALKLAQALGQSPEAVKFITAPPDWREILHYAEPIFAPAQLQAALASLATALCGRLAKAQLGAVELRAKFFRVDGQLPEILLRFASPCRDDPQISKLLNEKLQQIDPGFGVDAISLQAGTETLAASQITIERDAPDFSKPLNTLLNRLGPAQLWRARPHASHIPEYAARRAPVNLPPVPWGKPKHPRPVTLLKKPDAISVIAPVPDDPPVFFSWRGKSHRIRHATGPERIARDWWCHEHNNTRPEAEHIRDYYAVEDSEGARFWLFRTGLHTGEATPRWYLHGLFS